LNSCEAISAHVGAAEAAPYARALAGWGGLLNAVALLLFMVNTGRSMAMGAMRGESI
jgi:hypothetical protein